MCYLDLDLIISPGAQIGGTARLTVDDPSSGFFATPTLLLAGHLGSSNSPDLKRFNPSNLQNLENLEFSSPSNLQLSGTSDMKSYPSTFLEPDFPILLLRHFTTVQKLVLITRIIPLVLSSSSWNMWVGSCCAWKRHQPHRCDHPQPKRETLNIFRWEG